MDIKQKSQAIQDLKADLEESKSKKTYNEQEIIRLENIEAKLKNQMKTK